VPKISVTVITRNEAADIGDALASASWADELIVVDSESTDDTVAIARRYTERVVVREWPGYPAQKNYAASLASHDWILSLDADERVTPALAAEIQRTLRQDPGDKAFQSRASPITLGAGSGRPTGIPIRSFDSTTGGQHGGPDAACTNP
jgi:glycosyltransferase involved in cell wall biosynthesis